MSYVVEMYIYYSYYNNSNYMCIYTSSPLSHPRSFQVHPLELKICISMYWTSYYYRLVNPCMLIIIKVLVLLIYEVMLWKLHYYVYLVTIKMDYNIYGFIFLSSSRNMHVYFWYCGPWTLLQQRQKRRRNC